MQDEAYDKRQDLFAEYVQRFPIEIRGEKPFVIGLMGLVGSGKSTVAAAIGERLNIPTGSNDDIRRFLNTKGYAGDAPVQQTLQFIAEAASDYLYEHGVSHIIDADLFKFAVNARERAERQDFRFVLVEVACPEEIIRERIVARGDAIGRGGASNASRAGIEEFERRKAVWESLLKPDADFVIYTDQPLDSQIDNLIKLLQK